MTDSVDQALAFADDQAKDAIIRDLHRRLDRALSECVEVAELRQENEHLHEVIERQNQRLRRSA